MTGDEDRLRHLVRERPPSVEQWYGLTSVRFGGEHEPAHWLADVDAYLRVAYGMPSSKRT